jgi:hypothetical protein
MDSKWGAGQINKNDEKLEVDSGPLSLLFMLAASAFDSKALLHGRKFLEKTMPLWSLIREVLAILKV